MNNYFSTFITGFAEVVRESIKQTFPDVKIDLLLDGLISYRTEATISEIQAIPYFNNSYVQFNLFKKVGPEPFREMSDWIKANTELNQLFSQVLDREDKSFKLIFSENNLFIHMNKFLVENLEIKIRKDSGLRLEKQSGQREIWLLTRREKYSVIGLRLTNHGDYEKLLQKGELRPELSFMLCLLSDPSDDDVFLDPFAGSGSIPKQRFRVGPADKILAFDKSTALITDLVKRGDGLNLIDIEDATVSKIVTDPPWGITLNKDINIEEFYQKMLKEFSRILKPNGILILLTSRFILMDKITEKSGCNFKLIKKIDTLVNGQKATIFKYQKVVF